MTDDEQPFAYVIHYGNYYPREVDSIHPTRAEAETRLAELEAQPHDCGMWRIEEWYR